MPFDWSDSPVDRYWDWSDPLVEQNGIPQILTLPTVTIRGPNKKQLVFDNPLMSYRFHPIPEGAEDDEIAGMPVLFKEWQKTYRWATGEGLTTESNVTALNKYALCYLYTGLLTYDMCVIGPSRKVL